MTAPAFLGIDIGGTSIKWCVLREGLIEHVGVIATPRTDHVAVLAAVAQLVLDAPVQISGVGIAVPGTVDARRQRSVFLPNLPGAWVDLPVAALIQESTSLPVRLINDARAFAWAEHRSGAAVGIDNALFVTIGTGIGGAIALRGEILIADMDSIGEMGHFPVDPAGELCLCGGRGCLETIASASAISGRLARTVAMGQSTLLADMTAHGATALTAKHVAEAARAGDPWAADAYARAGEALGQATSAIALILQLDAVVIGGGLTPAADLYLPRVQAALDARISLTGPVRALSARFGHDAGAIGAATLAAAHHIVHPLPITSERTPS